jgi:hypothetical protein
LDKAITELNKVRTRSKMPALNSGSSFLVVGSKADMSKRIQHERAVELAGEGWRYFDLKRWNLLKASPKTTSKKVLPETISLRVVTKAVISFGQYQGKRLK